MFGDLFEFGKRDEQAVGGVILVGDGHLAVFAFPGGEQATQFGELDDVDEAVSRVVVDEDVGAAGVGPAGAVRGRTGSIYEGVLCG